MKIGLLGGTFNPAHEGHVHISEVAAKRLGLREVWWLVSPGNPMKPKADEKNYSERLKSAQNINKPSYIKIREDEKKLGTRYTIDILRRLKNLYPQHQFVWIMGADNLVDFHKWEGFQEILKLVAVMVLDREELAYKALAAKTAVLFSRFRRTSAASPAWQFLRVKRINISSSFLRNSKKQTKTNS